MEIPHTSLSGIKIVGITDIGVIINGNLKEINSINPCQIGYICDNQENIISEITPLIIIINQHRDGYEKIIDIMKKNGGDMNQEINYFGRKTTPLDIYNINHKNL